jgi:hypothetical protein
MFAVSVAGDLIYFADSQILPDRGESESSHRDSRRQALLYGVVERGEMDPFSSNGPSNCGNVYCQAGEKPGSGGKGG